MTSDIQFEAPTSYHGLRLVQFPGGHELDTTPNMNVTNTKKRGEKRA